MKRIITVTTYSDGFDSSANDVSCNLPESLSSAVKPQKSSAFKSTQEFTTSKKTVYNSYFRWQTPTDYLN